MERRAPTFRCFQNHPTPSKSRLRNSACRTPTDRNERISSNADIHLNRRYWAFSYQWRYPKEKMRIRCCLSDFTNFSRNCTLSHDVAMFARAKFSLASWCWAVIRGAFFMVSQVVCSLDRIEHHIVISETGRFIAAWICASSLRQFALFFWGLLRTKIENAPE